MDRYEPDFNTVHDSADAPPAAAAAYRSPAGTILLTSNGAALTGLYFAGQAHLPPLPPENGGDAVTDCAVRWLDGYFSGGIPDLTPPLSLSGTPFQRAVWERLTAIPYGKTTTYGAIAAELAALRGVPRISAQAVGQAVGRNPVSLIVPCHRVVGADGSLTGYAGGLSVKRFLLELESRSSALRHSV